MFYSPLVLRNAGMVSNDASSSSVLATILSDRAGRRPLLLACTAEVAATLLSVALTPCVPGDRTCRVLGGSCWSPHRTRLRTQGSSLGIVVKRLQACEHDVHLDGGLDHHGRVVLTVRQCRCGCVRICFSLGAGDQGHGARGDAMSER
ncbi:hypothetical protein EJB05_28304, partial [Eragrostis curvula]